MMLRENFRNVKRYSQWRLRTIRTESESEASHNVVSYDLQAAEGLPGVDELAERPIAHGKR